MYLEDHSRVISIGFLPISLISLLTSFACLFFFKVCFFFTLTRCLLLIILSFDPFAPLYFPLNGRVSAHNSYWQGENWLHGRIFQQDTSYYSIEGGNEGTQYAEHRKLKDQIKFFSASLVMFTDGPCSHP